jgi:hypothetical protein
MKKASTVLHKLKPTDKHYKKKVKILSKIINNTETGHILPNKLYHWAEKNKLKIMEHSTDHSVWCTVSGRKN